MSTLLCGKFIQDITQQILGLSETVKFYRSYRKTFWLTSYWDAVLASQ